MGDIPFRTRKRQRQAPAQRRSKSVQLFKAEVPENSHLAHVNKFHSQGVDADPYQDLYASTVGGLAIIEPEYSPRALISLPNLNSVLKQCIDAYAVNIESFGHRLEYIGDEDQRESAESLAEYARIKSLTDQPNSDYTVEELRRRIRCDYETLGYAFVEVVRNSFGEVVLMYHIPAHTLRLTARDRKAVNVSTAMVRNGKVVTQDVPTKFKRFVQLAGNRKTYFKQLGDPRIIDPQTGEENNSLAPEDAATEIYHFQQYAPGNAYGLPRWINQLPAVLGSRESEMTNLHFFKDNAIPAMAVLVAGGMLSEDSIEAIENQFVNHGGHESINRVMVLEAAADERAGSEKGQLPTPSISMEPLAYSRQSDALFQDYDEQCTKKVRSSFRLPPLYLGTTEDMTNATASSSITVTETQVFSPERVKVDNMFNQHLLALEGLQPAYWRFRSLPPRIVSAEDTLKALEVVNEVGGMTPNVSIGILNEILDLNIPEIKGAWGDYPFALVRTMAAAGGMEKQLDTLEKAIGELRTTLSAQVEG